MRLKAATVFLLVPLLPACVTVSKYNARVEEVRQLSGEVTSLEKALRNSQEVRNGLDCELRKARENLASLKKQHEEQVAASRAAGGETISLAALEAERQQFGMRIAELSTRLHEAQLRIRELTDELERREEAARKVPELEAAVAERQRVIVELSNYLRTAGAEVALLKAQTGELSGKHRGVEEKEDAALALRALLKEEISSGRVTVRQFGEKLVISLKEQVVFDSGSATISRYGRKTLMKMAKVLKKVKNNQIVVEGHTDTVPIGRNLAARYPTNWDLAAARATTVLKFLEKRGKLNSRLLALAGYGSYLPAAANDSPKNRRLNRRIEIAVVPLHDRLSEQEKVAMR